MVQRSRKAILDACPGDHWTDLADSLPDHPRQLWVRIRAGASAKGAVARGIALRHQSRIEPDLHSDPVRSAEPAVGSGGHPDRVGCNHLDDGRCLATLSLGGSGSSAVFRLGFACDGAATLDYGDELGKMMLFGLLPFRPFCF